MSIVILTADRFDHRVLRCAETLLSIDGLGSTVLLWPQ